MYNREITFNWRSTMGNPANVPAPIASYLDLLSELFQDDGMYRHFTSNRHTCACDDPIVMLHHVRRTGMCVTPHDHRLYDESVSYVRGAKPMYFSDAEVERRMQAAESDCPMCGFRPVFHEPGSDGRRTMMMRCQHITNYSVEGDVEVFLKQARVWEGKSWPYAWMQGHKLTIGDKVLRENGSAPCQGCLEMEAIERVEQSLLKLVTTSGQMQFAKPGWSSPVCSFWSERDADSLRQDRLLMRVKSVVAEAQDSFGDSKEVRLNDAGLKLFIKPVRSGRSVREINFGMRVGGDQVADYPGFQDYAHSLFREMGVPTTTA